MKTDLPLLGLFLNVVALSMVLSLQSNCNVLEYLGTNCKLEGVSTNGCPYGHVPYEHDCISKGTSNHSVCINDTRTCVTCNGTFYLYSCEGKCSPGCLNAQCELVTGICTAGCKSDYSGDNCSQAKPSLRDDAVEYSQERTIYVLSAGAVILVVIFGIFGIITYVVCSRRNERKQMKQSAGENGARYHIVERNGSHIENI